MHDDIRQRAANVKMLVLDVDGVLTDGGLYYDSQGNVSKRFNIMDGLGIKLAQGAGLEIGVITGLDNPAVRERVQELGITEYFAGKLKKTVQIEDICGRRGLEFDELAYLGDDLIDGPPMRMVGLPMAVVSGCEQVKGIADWVSTKPGGHGAVREAIEFILQARGQWDDVCREWGF